MKRLARATLNCFWLPLQWVTDPPGWYVHLLFSSSFQGGGPSSYSGGPRSYGPPGSPPYSSRPSMNDPYNGDYGLRGPDDMGYGPLYGSDYGPDGYYGGPNGMRHMGPSGDGYSDYRAPYRHW